MSGRFVAGLLRRPGLRRRATLKRKACCSQGFTFECRIDGWAPRSGADEATSVSVRSVLSVVLLFFVFFVSFVIS